MDAPIFRVTPEMEAELADAINDSSRTRASGAVVDRWEIPRSNRQADPPRPGVDPTPTVVVPQPSSDPVNHPAHYTVHPSGVECITVTEWMTFNLGNCVKYIWRADHKGATIQDLEKARWYLDREIERLRGLQ